MNSGPCVWCWEWKQWFPMSEEVDAEFTKHGIDIHLLGWKFNFACGLPRKRCSHHSKVLHSTFRQTEVTTGHQMSRQVCERNRTSKECCSSQVGHYTPEICRSLLWSSENTQVLPHRTTTPFLVSRNTSREDSFLALGSHIGCRWVVCNTTTRIFLLWFKEVRTTQSYSEFGHDTSCHYWGFLLDFLSPSRLMVV